MDELNRAYEALQKAHDAGDVEGAKQIAEYARSLEAGSKADNYEAGADQGLGIPESAIGAAMGATLGAAAGPAVGATVDTAANIGAKMVNPTAANAANMPAGNSPAAVRKWLATQTSNPYAGGKDQSEAYRKAELAAGKPVQSRGSKTPIRKGRLGIENQIPETTLPQKAAANIINAEKVGKPGVGRRVAGMGVAGAELGNAIEEAKKGNIGRAALSGLGTLGGTASQSSNKTIRRIGTGLSVAVPAIQKFVLPDEDEEVQKKAAGGKIAKKLVGFLESTPKKPDPLVGTRYKSTDLGGLIQPTPFDIESALHAKVMHRPYDLSGRNQRIEEVSGHQLTNPVITEGGQPFGRDIKLQATGQGGASNKSINDRILKRVEAAAREGDGRVFNVPSSMTYGSEAFSNMPIDIILDLIKQREFSPETLKYLSDLVRAKSPALQNFVGFGDPNVTKQLTEGGFGLTTTPGKLRVGATQAMMGKENKAQSLIDYNHEDLFNAIRAPELRDVPPGYMGETIMEAVPGHPGFKTGSHGAYDSGDASTYRGQGINAPISLWMPDSYKRALAEVRSAPKTAEKSLGHQRAMARNVLGTAEEGVAQTITPQVADNLQRFQEAVKEGKLDKNDLEAIHKYIYGDKAHEYAKGGKVGILEAAAAAFKKQFTPGFYHGSPSNKIKEFDPSKGSIPDVKDHITPNVTFVTPKPEFAESFLPEGFDSTYRTGSTMYPVNVNLGKHFDPNTPEGSEVVRQYLLNKYKKEADTYGFDEAMNQKHEHYMDKLTHPVNNWKLLENPEILDYLKNTGHNSFSVTEGGIKNVGIFDPKHIRGKFAKYNPEDAESADFMKAAGGAVQHFDGGGKVGNMLSLLKKLGLSEESIAAWKAANGVNQRQVRNPLLQQAAKDLAEGKITSEQYRALARVEMPINPFTSAPNMPSQQDIGNALKSNQLETGIIGVNKDIAPGTRVSSRLDIPAYDKYDKWIVSLHDPLDAGKSIGYGQTAHLKGPIDFTASPKAGHAIATGKADKTTYARIHGDWEPTDPEDVYKRAQDLMGDPQWAQVGLNPFRHSYFYDKADMAPVVGGQEALQVGPLVLVKKPQKVDPDDPRFRLSKDKPETFAPGGLIKGALSLFKGKADDATSKYHPQVQKGLAEGRIDPADAQWMSDYANTPGNSQVETGTGAFKDQSERMQNFLGRIKSGEVKTPSGWEK